MPLYEIHHSTPLLPHQLSAIAKAITNLHCSTFSAPSSFVNIVFHPATTSETTIGPAIYVGGEQHQTNYIIGHLRPRPSKPRDTLNTLVEGLTAVWNEVVRARPLDASAQTTTATTSGRLDDARGLHNVFLMEDIAAGAEQGFVLPVAGRDAQWAEQNMREFERRAGLGDRSMGRLVGEVRMGFGRSKL